MKNPGVGLQKVVEQVRVHVLAILQDPPAPGHEPLEVIGDDAHEGVGLRGGEPHGCGLGSGGRVNRRVAHEFTVGEGSGGTAVFAWLVRSATAVVAGSVRRGSGGDYPASNVRITASDGPSGTLSVDCASRSTSRAGTGTSRPSTCHPAGRSALIESSAIWAPRTARAAGCLSPQSASVCISMPLTIGVHSPNRCPSRFTIRPIPYASRFWTRSKGRSQTTSYVATPRG